MSTSEALEEVVSSPLKPAGESCNFETYCSWTSSISMDGKPHWVQTHVGELSLQDQMQLVNKSRSLDDGILLLNTSQFSESCIKAQLLSPLYLGSLKTCELELMFYSQGKSTSQRLKVMIQDKKSNLTTELPPLREEEASQWSPWRLLSAEIGGMDSTFQISVDYELCFPRTETFLVLDSLHLRNCFGGNSQEDLYSCPWESSFLCKNGECIGRTKVCDFQMDCPGGDDEGAICENILPLGAHCTFEQGTCHWTANTTTGSSWTYADSVQLKGEDNIHLLSTEGHFLYLPIKNEHNSSTATLYSDFFPPVLPNKTCQFTLKFLIYGTLNGTLAVYAQEENAGTDTAKLWQTEGSQSDSWSSATFKIPQFNNRFRMQLVATWGRDSLTHIIVDNITFSADCFNSGRIEFSPGELERPGQRDPWEDETVNPLSEPIDTEEEEEMEWRFSTCGAIGPHGPTQAQCNNAYRNKNYTVIVGKDGPLKSVQMWRVPFTKVYTISSYGAAGGKGAKNHNKRCHGIFMSGVFHLEKDELLYILVGQQGEDACPGKNNKTQKICMGELSVIEDEYREKNSLSDWAGGGGGGGGATYVFKEVNGVFIPLLVGAGGGGKAYLEDPYDESDFEQQETFERNMAIPGLNGNSGAAGGHASQLDDVSADGQDGVSFINPSGEMFLHPLAATENDGEVRIEFYLNCSHCKSGSCMKDREQRVVCLCDAGTMLAVDNITCEAPKGPVPDRQLPLPLILAVLIATVILGVIFACGSLSFVYHRKKKQLEGARVRLQSTEYKLSKIRSSIIMTDYNPNYCFAGKGAGLSELKEVPRKNITLLRALGHGAFGEVYEGLVVGISGDPNPLQVAIKTLPEICSEQDEMDFLMEALIISKFNHQNIVRCIGVSLQTLPRFILLELMSGGDMKTFLRQNRPWVDQPSKLTMSDLLNMARDIACGCKYLEENHFIHRDIAARNCLLNHTSSGRVAKIGDFGMARDIYRASYYRKGGRAMLPVKWMPPEAFLEGIFTSKTDSWSFGVLLWEIFSLGYMPYPCKTNQEVLEFVTSGGRMDPPKNCPGPVYRIMTQCWQHTPDHRPNFSTILERIIYCTQDPDVINTDLPVESCPALEDEGSTIMRPSSCNGMTPLLGNPTLPVMMDTQTMEHKLADIPEELRVENLAGWNLRAPSVGEPSEGSWAPSNPISTSETKPQMSHKLKNKSKNLWNPTYGSWVMESTC